MTRIRDISVRRAAPNVGCIQPTFLPRVHIHVTYLTYGPTEVQLRRFATWFIYSHSGATGIDFLATLSRCILPGWSHADRREHQDQRSQAETGGFTNTNSSRPLHCALLGIVFLVLGRS